MPALGGRLLLRSASYAIVIALLIKEQLEWRDGDPGAYDLRTLLAMATLCVIEQVLASRVWSSCLIISVVVLVKELVDWRNGEPNAFDAPRMHVVWAMLVLTIIMYFVMRDPRVTQLVFLSQ
mmetsp:Transcript_7376/g.13097  ORF Transcript_7376/g.13097 Transcript_7376/m.13097 type:complete len:122 (-) Transcript_7376:391-756(-)